MTPKATANNTMTPDIIPTSTQNSSPTNITHNERTLLIYLGYRFILGLLLLLMFYFLPSGNVLGSTNGTLFKLTSIFYTTLCFGSLFVFQPRRLTHSTYRLTFLLVSDIIALVLLIHSSGGIGSGLAYLLMTFAAIASIFVSGKMTVAFAAFISLFIMSETLYLSLGDKDFSRDMFASGTLGILIFSTSLIFHYLSEKIRKTSAEAKKQALHVENLQKISQVIIQRMRTGIIVIDNNDRISQINDAARQMLDLPELNTYLAMKISELSNLKIVVDEWKLNPIIGIPCIHYLRAGQQVRINFATLDNNGNSQIILYIEDNRAITQQAQQLKLASLGRLTASIAHEVRNPLGAIAHASQLLKESEEMVDQDKYLLTIILNHSDRVNQLIENILSLSRRKEARAELIELNSWCRTFINELTISNDYIVKVESNSEKVFAKIDPVHLGQILTNLVDNAARYSKLNTGKPTVELIIGLSKNTEKAYLHVIDFGKGIDPKNQEEVFEPFFTTDQKGSGLGLFISKELCEINQASLIYFKTKQELSCFRIDFSHHQRVI